MRRDGSSQLLLGWEPSCRVCGQCPQGVGLDLPQELGSPARCSWLGSCQPATSWALQEGGDGGWYSPGYWQVSNGEVTLAGLGQGGQTSLGPQAGFSMVNSW